MKGINRFGRFFLGAAFAAMMVVGCNDPANGTRKTVEETKVKITFEADGGFKLAEFKKAFPMKEAVKGTTFASMKTVLETQAKKHLNNNKLFDKWQYKKAAVFADIPAGFKFEADTVLRAVSKDNTPPNPPSPPTETKVTLTLQKGDGVKAIKEGSTEKATIEVEKTEKWSEIVKKITVELNDENNYTVEWHKDTADGALVGNDDTFAAAATLFAVAKLTADKVKITFTKDDATIGSVKKGADDLTATPFIVEKTTTVAALKNMIEVKDTASSPVVIPAAEYQIRESKTAAAEIEDAYLAGKGGQEITLHIIKGASSAPSNVTIALTKDGDGFTDNIEALVIADGEMTWASIKAQADEKVKAKLDAANGYSIENYDIEYTKAGAGSSKEAVKDTDKAKDLATVYVTLKIKGNKVKLVFKKDASVTKVTEKGQAAEITFKFIDATATWKTVTDTIDVHEASAISTNYKAYKAESATGTALNDSDTFTVEAGKIVNIFFKIEAAGNNPGNVTITLMKTGDSIRGDIDKLTNVATNSQWSALKANADKNVKNKLNVNDDYKEEYYTIEYYKNSAMGQLVGESETFSTDTTLYVVLKIKAEYKRINLAKEDASISLIAKSGTPDMEIKTFVVERSKDFNAIKALLVFKKEAATIQSDKIKASKGSTKGAEIEGTDTLDAESVDLFFWAE